MIRTSTTPYRSVRARSDRNDFPHRLSHDPFPPDRLRRVAYPRLVRAGIPPSDFDDLLQDLQLRLIRAERRFDARCGTLEHFVLVIVERGIAQHRRSRGRCQHWFPLDPAFAPEFLVDWHDDADAADLRLDVTEILAGLPEPLRATAIRLKNDTKAEAARNLKISRQTLNTRVRGLRRAFERYRFRNS